MYQPYCPWAAGHYMYNYPDMYRSEEEDASVETLGEEVEEFKEEDERQPPAPQGQGYPGPGPGYPGPGYGGGPGYPGPGHGGGPGFPGHFPQNPDRILNLIEYNDPEILRTMTLYGIPVPAARRLIRRIVMVTLRFCR